MNQILSVYICTRWKICFYNVCAQVNRVFGACCKWGLIVSKQNLLGCKYSLFAVSITCLGISNSLLEEKHAKSLLNSSKYYVCAQALICLELCFRKFFVMPFALQESNNSRETKRTLFAIYESKETSLNFVYACTLIHKYIYLYDECFE